MDSETKLIRDNMAEAAEKILLRNLARGARQFQRENPRLSDAEAYAKACESYPAIYEECLAAGVRARRGRKM